MMLVYYEGNGSWFDFPIVDRPRRVDARNKWDKENPAPIWNGQNDDEWELEFEQYSTKLEQWKKDNPPPKYKMVEDEIYLESEQFLDLSTPVLHYQPEKAFVSAVFKLKAKDERRLRYKKKVTVSILLPCDHPDGDNSGFFFQLNEPYTFTTSDIVLDEPFKGSSESVEQSKSEIEPTKLEKQRQAILDVCKSKKYDPMKIPDGGKGILKKICETDYPDLFDGETSFDNAWKTSKKLFRMANHASYSRRGVD